MKKYQLIRGDQVVIEGTNDVITEHLQNCLYEILEFSPLLEMDEEECMIFAHSENYLTLSENDYEDLRNNIGIHDLEDDDKVHLAIMKYFSFNLISVTN